MDIARRTNNENGNTKGIRNDPENTVDVFYKSPAVNQETNELQFNEYHCLHPFLGGKQSLTITYQMNIVEQVRIDKYGRHHTEFSEYMINYVST